MNKKEKSRPSRPREIKGKSELKNYAGSGALQQGIKGLTSRMASLTRHSLEEG